MTFDLPAPIAEQAASAEALTRFLRQSIPVLASVELRALVANPQRVVLSAPLAVNHNHHQTAFGGSLALVGIVSGWALLHLALQAEGLSARLVVQKSEIDYRLPVAEDLVAETQRPDDAWPAFVERLRTRGKARIDLLTRVRAADADGVLLKGTYAAALE
ncbi:YiiD C-terminal domain-containing protein [Hydrocarboniphaga effusa]|uniref:YiiD C-terminal domain-containing protein n=1 Tax=Hydrocarboniphaga effusa TaxID=243629 RepID=UPI00398C063A